MIDIKKLRENPDLYRKNLEKRKAPEKLKWLEELIELDAKWRQLKYDVQKVVHQKKQISMEINEMKKKGEDITIKLKRLRQIPETLTVYEAEMGKMKEKIDYYLKHLPNLMHESVPYGQSDQDNPTLKEVGKKPTFDFEIKDHIDLALELDILDLDTARSNSGARFYYLKNDGVLLDLALQRFAIDQMLKEEFKLVYPPFMLNRAALEGGVNMSEFQDTIYKIEDEDLYLIGTSEHPLVAMKKDKTVDETELPIKMCGVSTCFRKEAGTHGKDDKGIFRVHQFNKIEQIVYCKPEESYKFFDYIQNLSEKLFEQLGIPFRVVQICTGDLGNKQALQYDIEAWFPAQDNKNGQYREVTSCSNCTDYQAVTLNTKYLDKDRNKQYVHMLNNTALATARAIAAILENNQQKDGSIKIPEVLIPYMNGKKVITKL